MRSISTALLLALLASGADLPAAAPGPAALHARLLPLDAHLDIEATFDGVARSETQTQFDMPKAKAAAVAVAVADREAVERQCAAGLGAGETRRERGCRSPLKRVVAKMSRCTINCGGAATVQLLSTYLLD